MEETIKVSLRFLGTDTPNLKDAAFAFKRIEEEVKDPLQGKLAAIKRCVIYPISQCISLESRFTPASRPT